MKRSARCEYNLIRSGAGKWASILMLLSLCFFAGTNTQAQATKAEITGTVHDPTGAAIPNAEITVTNTGTNEVRKATSGGDGLFAVNLLNPGTYKISIHTTGFKAFEVPSLTLAAGDSPRLDAAMEIGATTETISVEAATPLLQSENSSLGSSVNQVAVQDLPLNGRNFVQLVQLVPGANEGPPNSLTNGTKPDDKRISASFSANGQSEVLNNQMVDGMDNNESLIGSVGVRPSVDAVSEIRVQTAVYSADTGRTGGAAVNIISKSGTNNFHGSAYEYFRNDIFNTYPFLFGQHPCGGQYVFPACTPKQRLRQNQFGGSIGGPIFKDKTFFFGDYEGFRLVQGANPTVSTVPTLFEEQNPGNFTDQPGNLNVGVLPPSSLDPAALNYFALFPAPNAGTIGGTCTSPTSCKALQGQFIGVGINTQFSHVFDIRLDHKISDNNSVFGRYSYNNVKTWNPTTFPVKSVAGLSIMPTGAGYSPNNTHNTSLSYIHTFTQSLLMQIQAGYLRVVNSTYPASFGNGNTIGPTVNTAYGMPGVNISGFTSGLAHVGWNNGYTTLGGGAFTPLTDLTNAYQLMGTVTYTRGAHNLKFGAGALQRRLKSIQSAAGLPQWTFNDMPTFLQGTFTLVNRQLATRDPNYNRWETSLYAQDDWRVSSNTTLNLGVRYDIYTPLCEKHGVIATWNPNTAALMVGNTPGVSCTANVRTFYGGIVPRIGFATTIHHSLVIRGGFGMSIYPDSITSNATPKNPPFLSAYGPNNPAAMQAQFNGGFSKLVQGAPALSQIPIYPQALVGSVRAATDPNFRPGAVYQYSLSIQRDFHGNVLTVSYIGIQARHSPQSFTDLNAPAPNTQTVGSTAAQALRPNYTKWPQLTNIGWYASGGAGSYNAATISFERRLARGLNFNTNYTYARLLDNAVGMSNQNTVAYGYWVPISHSYDYSNSDLDLRNRFVASINYALPFFSGASGFKGAALKGWQLNTILAWNAGQPVTPLNATSLSGTNQLSGGDRPNRIGNPTISGKTIAKFFNTAAYANQTLGTLGNSQRNTLYGPHYRHVDLSLIKSFPIYERLHLDFRAEAFNITNTANFSTPNVTLGQGTYGTITAMSPAYSPRVFQFAVKFIF
jgi:hypothetical protein